MTHLVYNLLPDHLFDGFVVVISFLDSLIDPFLKPLIRGVSHDGYGAPSYNQRNLVMRASFQKLLVVPGYRSSQEGSLAEGNPMKKAGITLLMASSNSKLLKSSKAFEHLIEKSDENKLLGRSNYFLRIAARKSPDVLRFQSQIFCRAP
jgi:hypothetical protein